MVEQTHDFLRPSLHRQAICIDATLGQGKDSQFFLEEGVSRVIAFEIQQEAIDLVLKKIQDPRLEIHHLGHEHIQDMVTQKVDAIVFNFGYCPCLDHAVTTLPETSYLAVQQALERLKPRGRMVLVLYPHEKGQEEAQLIEEYCQMLDHRKFHVQKVQMLNTISPYRIEIEKIR